jgi:hypothetical protein
MNAYDGHCIFAPTLEYYVPEDANNSTLTSLLGNDGTSKISEVFNETYAIKIAGSDDFYYPTKDLVFMKNSESLIEIKRALINLIIILIDSIHEMHSAWGFKSSCEYSVFIPIFQLCFAIILSVMFVICGKGGKGDTHSFLPQPWRIVTPALVFFLVMLFMSIAYVSIVQSGVTSFCKELTKNIPGIDCSIALNHFALRSYAAMPSTYLILLNVFIWILLSCWIILTTIMIARIILAVDFQLVKITVKTCEYENETKSNNDQTMTSGV